MNGDSPVTQALWQRAVNWLGKGAQGGLENYADALTNQNRGAVLPIERDPQTGSYSPAFPRAMDIINTLPSPVEGAGVALGAGGALRKGSVIGDWRWRPPGEVAAQLGPMSASPAVKGFGDFMLGQAQKAVRGELTTRDVVKAFTITRASIQRSAQSTAKLRENWPGFPGGTDKVRPEGAFAEWLLTPTGKQYLDAAEHGKVDLGAVGDAVQKLRGFGKENDLIDSLTTAPTLKGSEGHVGEMIAASFQKPGAGNPAWRDWTKELRGIGPAKSGFVGSLLGKGDMPTLDARQVILNTGEPTAAAQGYLQRQGGAGADAAVDRLAKRQASLNMDMPAELEPFRQHLTHHEVWDRVGNENTTHEDLIRAMQLASKAPSPGSPVAAALANRSTPGSYEAFYQGGGV